MSSKFSKIWHGCRCNRENLPTHTPHTHVQSQKYGIIPLSNTVFKPKRETQWALCTVRGFCTQELCKSIKITHMHTFLLLTATYFSAFTCLFFFIPSLFPPSFLFICSMCLTLPGSCCLPCWERQTERRAHSFACLWCGRFAWFLRGAWTSWKFTASQNVPEATRTSCRDSLPYFLYSHWKRARLENSVIWCWFLRITCETQKNR